MGQYWKVVNLDKKEQNGSDSGLKLTEWCYRENTVTTEVACLLREGNLGTKLVLW